MIAEVEYLSYEFGLHLKQCGIFSQLTPLGTPHHYTVVFQVAWVVKLFHIVLTEGQTRNSNISPLRSYHRNFYFLVMMILHFTMKFFELFQMFQTCVSSSRYTHICSNHLWRLENNDIRREPQHSSDRIHQYVISIKSVARSIVLENGVLVILPMRHGLQVPSDS